MKVKNGQATTTEALQMPSATWNSFDWQKPKEMLVQKQQEKPLKASHCSSSVCEHEPTAGEQIGPYRRLHVLLS